MDKNCELSLNPEDACWRYAEPTAAQVEEQRRLLGFSNPPLKRPALEALSPKCHDLDDLMLDMLPEHDEEEEEKEEEEELEDEECNCPSAACDPQGLASGGKGGQGFEAAAAAAERSQSDASTSTTQLSGGGGCEEHDGMEDLLLLDTSAHWREWVGFDHHAWHHGGGTPHEASSASTFLKLNHEATAKLLNRTLHHGDAGGAGAQVMA